jgi:hypothetical protein
MPLNSEDLPTNSRQEFCLALKATRERQGITLNQIAEATKIPASLFAGLERNDLRHWPHGLFRRSFFRDYAGMIGLPATEACAQFVRLFVDDEKAEVAAGLAPTPAEAEGVRLVLDAAWHGPRASVRSRVLAALIDGGCVTVAGMLAGWSTGISWPLSIAIVALVYFSLATAVFDKSPASWAIAKGKSMAGAPTPVLAAIADALRHVLGRPDATSTEDPETQPWVTDARRVAPAPSPRFRARIKLPH